MINHAPVLILGPGPQCDCGDILTVEIKMTSVAVCKEYAIDWPKLREFLVHAWCECGFDVAHRVPLARAAKQDDQLRDDLVKAMEHYEEWVRSGAWNEGFQYIGTLPEGEPPAEIFHIPGIYPVENLEPLDRPESQRRETGVSLQGGGV